MTTFTEFQEYFIRLMWRTGDTEFANDLPRLVKKAEARINRDLRQIGMTAEYLGTLEGVDRFELPLDYVEARSVTIDGINAVFRAITWQEMAARRSDGTTFSNTYAQDGGYMYLNINPNSGVVQWVRMSYYSKVRPFDTVEDENDTTGFYDQHPDFFEAALRVQCYDYLREFELSAEFNGKYEQLLNTMKELKISQEFPAGALPVQLPGIVF